MKVKINITEILILTVVLLILFYSSDPIIYKDSARYLQKSLLDPPMYSTLILTMRFIFGTLNSVIILQTLLMGIGIIYFTRTITIQFNLDILVKTIISISLLLPILQFYRNLLTDPLSYAFSLLFVSFIIKLIYNFNYQNLLWSIFFAIALLLTRNQFIFIYPVVLFLFVGIFILNRSMRTFTWLLVGFISILFIHNSLVYLNINVKKILNYEIVAEEKFGPYFFTYFDAIYISSTEDVELFKNEKIKKTLVSIFKEVDNRKASVKYYNGRGHFGLSLNQISDTSQILLENLAKEQKTDIKSLKKNISIKLIVKNFGKYIKHIFKKFYDSTWLFIFLPFFMMLAGLISFLKNKSRFALVIIFVSTFAFANHFLVYLFGRVQPRYFIYTDFILLIFIFITFIILFEKKEKKFM
jgi:hypothetical protein